jgi:tRNA threonylcarbamoyl adenosine modification protein YeaZ
MKVLAIDSALGACSAAVWDQTVMSGQQKIMSRGHVEELIPMVQAVVTESDLEFAQLELIAVSIGPGSFTGLRAGLAAARGLGLPRWKLLRLLPFVCHQQRQVMPFSSRSKRSGQTFMFKCSTVWVSL